MHYFSLCIIAYLGAGSFSRSVDKSLTKCMHTFAFTSTLNKDVKFNTSCRDSASLLHTSNRGNNIFNGRQVTFKVLFDPTLHMHYFLLLDFKHL